MNNTSLASLELDVEVAVMAVHEYGHLTPFVQDGLSKWFEDFSADIALPMKEMPLDDIERSAVLILALEEMLRAIRSVKVKNLDDAESFPILAPVLKPLWLEIYSIFAPIINKAWQDIRPTDQDDLECLVAYVVSVFGMGRTELYTSSQVNTKLRIFLSKMGLTPVDLK